MSEHYYTQKPQSKSKPQTWNHTFDGVQYTFTTDDGVFSKTRVDFGSRLLIEQFRKPAVQGDILDLGCGYGPIGIMIANKYRDEHIVMTDINERAVMLAKQNVKQNQIINAEVILSDRFEQLSNRMFSAILTNPPIRAGKKIIYSMFKDSFQALKNKGELWIVIQQKQGAPSAKKKLQELFGNATLIERKKGYHIFKAVKY